MTAPRLERLFVYGVLRASDLQLDTFGRIVESRPGILPGYTVNVRDIADNRFTDADGATLQPVLRRTGDPRDKVPGEVLRLELFELEAADEMQMATFRRTLVRLSDGKDAWVYL